MLVRLRLSTGPRLRSRQRDLARPLRLAFAVFLTPAALMAAILACWKIGSDLSWVDEFAISTGPFSHWQVWLIVAIGLQLGAYRLNRRRW